MWEIKYLQRLARVYLDKYETYGFDTAQLWYNGFLNDDLRGAIKPYVEAEILERLNNRKK